MNYITFAEHIGIEKGFQQGLETGMQKGLQEGEATLLTRLLRCRFQKLPANYMARIQQADINTLLLWAERIFGAANLDEVFV